MVSSNIGSGSAAAYPLILTPAEDAIVGRNLLFLRDNAYGARGVENLRIVRGTVNANGTRLAGAGFDVSHAGGSGSYQITFTQPFSGVPTVTVSAVDVLARSGGSLTTNSVTVGTMNFSGTAQDDAFNFTAIGPP